MNKVSGGLNLKLQFDNMCRALMLKQPSPYPSLPKFLVLIFAILDFCLNFCYPGAALGILAWFCIGGGVTDSEALDSSGCVVKKNSYGKGKCTLFQSI